jgi:hypothetical protein
MVNPYVNPNYNYSPEVSESEPLDLSEVTSALERVEMAVRGHEYPEAVEVKNLDEIKKHLRLELKAVVDAVKAIDIPEPSKEVRISNFPASEKHPDSVSVKNLGELSSLLSLLISRVEGLNVNPIVNVPAPIVNIAPSEAPVVNIPQALPPIVDLDLSSLLSALKPLGLLSRDPNKPITVRMSDGRSFIDAIASVLKDNGERLATVVSTSYGLTKDEYKAATRELGDPTTTYKATDVDADASPNYYGFTDQYGGWYIMKETLSTGADTYRYCKGSSAYTTAWTNRDTQIYDYFYEVF